MIACSVQGRSTSSKCTTTLSLEAMTTPYRGVSKLTGATSVVVKSSAILWLLPRTPEKARHATSRQ